MHRIRAGLEKLSAVSADAFLPFLAVFSLLLDFLLEILSRRSVVGAFLFVASQPLMYLCNSLILLFTLSLCLLFGRRITALLFITAGWLGLGIANFVLLSFRSSPLSAIDFLIVRSLSGMLKSYLQPLTVVGILLLIIGFVTLTVLLHRRFPRSPVRYGRSLSRILLVGIVLFGSVFAVSASEADEAPAAELAKSYESYGFAYCFTRSLISQGVERPDDYSPDRLGELVETLEDSADSTPDTLNIRPNLLYVQLESFFDVNYVKGLTFSENPLPHFTALKESGIRGFLSVNHIGGGTANTEFEILTGMNLDHFGFGEYPYTTILKERACESIAASLRKLGWRTHAIHNHTGTFYDRHIAYSNLGFDTFTPVEMMNGVTLNPLGWEEDAVLTGEILSALDSTAGPDFVFTVTVQGHGNYPSEAPGEGASFTGSHSGWDPDNALITVYGADDEEQLHQFTYYVNQLRETDRFIGELTLALEARAEPTVVVFYGDHMPSIGLTEDGLSAGSLYQTEYVIWSNTDRLPETGDGRDLDANQLSAYVQQLLGLAEGDIARLHQHSFAAGEEIGEELKLLEYAQLYDEEAPRLYRPTALRFGTQPLTVTGAYRRGNTLYVRGSGFTPHSKVKLGAFEKNTVFLDDTLLLVENVYFSPGEVAVAQIADDGTELAIARLRGSITESVQ